MMGRISLRNLEESWEVRDSLSKHTQKTFTDSLFLETEFSIISPDFYISWPGTETIRLTDRRTDNLISFVGAD